MDMKNCKSVLITAMIMLSLLGGLVGCASPVEPKKVNSNNEPKKEASKETAKTDKQKEEKEIKKEFAANETIELKGMHLNVTKVERSNGSDFDKPKEGNEFVIVSVKIQNKGTEKLDYNPFYFKIQNSKGQITDESFTTINQDTALNSGELAPNGEVTGTLAFEAPKGDKGLKLLYKDNIFKEDEQIIIKLN